MVPSLGAGLAPRRIRVNAVSPGAVRQPADGAVPPAVTVPVPGTCRSAARRGDMVPLATCHLQSLKSAERLVSFYGTLSGSENTKELLLPDQTLTEYQ
jgi:NAD(P)-dependent dehydrogenase (short-subunit alcohol dehydrogenase family)